MCFTELNDLFGPEFSVFTAVNCTSFSLSIARLDPARRMSLRHQEAGDGLDEPAGTADVTDGFEVRTPQGGGHHGLVAASGWPQRTGRDAPLGAIAGVR